MVSDEEHYVHHLRKKHPELQDAFDLIIEAEQCIDRIEGMLSWKTYFKSERIIEASDQARMRLYRREKFYNTTLRMHWPFEFFNAVKRNSHLANVRNGQWHTVWTK